MDRESDEEQTQKTRGSGDEADVEVMPGDEIFGHAGRISSRTPASVDVFGITPATFVGGVVTPCAPVGGCDDVATSGDVGSVVAAGAVAAGAVAVGAVVAGAVADGGVAAGVVDGVAGDATLDVAAGDETPDGAADDATLGRVDVARDAMLDGIAVTVVRFDCATPRVRSRSASTSATSTNAATAATRNASLVVSGAGSRARHRGQKPEIDGVTRPHAEHRTTGALEFAWIATPGG